MGSGRISKSQLLTSEWKFKLFDPWSAGASPDCSRAQAVHLVLWGAFYLLPVDPFCPISALPSGKFPLVLGRACLEGCLGDSVFAAGTLPSSIQQLQAAQLKHRTTSKLMLTFPTQIPDGRLGVSSLITPSSSSPHPTPILDGTNRGTGIFHQLFLSVALLHLHKINYSSV